MGGLRKDRKRAVSFELVQQRSGALAQTEYFYIDGGSAFAEIPDIVCPDVEHQMKQCAPDMRFCDLAGLEESNCLFEGFADAVAAQPADAVGQIGRNI